MRKKRKLKPDKKVIPNLFPPEVVDELERSVEEYDSDTQVRENPTGKLFRRRRPYRIPKE
ncbi:MAG TPA: hypothetical protein VEG64_15140 [Candidatus Sulfotelmatobacter sp.]|nr:hypothetical protein [Candidatus Sulfotelmatobacter sp.]